VNIQGSLSDVNLQGTGSLAGADIDPHASIQAYSPLGLQSVSVTGPNGAVPLNPPFVVGASTYTNP
jgi:hypothetical protein